MMDHKERIGLHDDVKSMLIKMSEGNPGGLNVLLQLLTKSEIVDPDSALGSLTYILNLDFFGIYGSKIWMLYKDICGENIIHTMAVLRAIQLGIIPSVKIKNSLSETYGRCEDIDVEDIFKKVKEALPRFAAKEETTEGKT